MFRDVLIGGRLAAGFAMVLLLTIVIGVAAIINARSLAGLTEALSQYQHPYKVTNALRTANNDMVTIAAVARAALLSRDPAANEASAAQSELLTTHAMQQIALADAQYLGDKRDIQVLADAGHGDWNPTRARAFPVNWRGRVSSKSLSRYSTARARYRCAPFSRASPRRSRSPRRRRRPSWSGPMARPASGTSWSPSLRWRSPSIAGGLIAWRIATGITRPLRELKSRMDAMAGGELDGVVPHVARRDEIGEMARTVAVFQREGLEKQRLAAAGEDEQSRK